LEEGCLASLTDPHRRGRHGFYSRFLACHAALLRTYQTSPAFSITRRAATATCEAAVTPTMRSRRCCSKLKRSVAKAPFGGLFKRALRLGLVASNLVHGIPKLREAGRRLVYLRPTVQRGQLFVTRGRGSLDRLGAGRVEDAEKGAEVFASCAQPSSSRCRAARGDERGGTSPHHGLAVPANR
jgi:hypothetical protein